MPAFCEPAIVRSSTSVKFMTWRTRVVLEVAERAPKHIDRHERSEVADVSPAVHRQPARIHADEVVLGWREFFFGPRQRVVETHAMSRD